MKVIYVYNGIQVGNGIMTCLPRKCDYVKFGNNIYMVSAIMFECISEVVAVIYIKDTLASEQVKLKYI